MHNFINFNILHISSKKQFAFLVCSKGRCIITIFHADLLLTIFITTRRFFTCPVSTASEEEFGQEYYTIHFSFKYITYTLFNNILLQNGSIINYFFRHISATIFGHLQEGINFIDVFILRGNLRKKCSN
jgi:hypothetical protein